RFPSRADLILGCPPGKGQLPIREAEFLGAKESLPFGALVEVASEIGPVACLPTGKRARFLDDLLQVAQEPAIDFCQLINFLQWHAIAIRLRDMENPFGIGMESFR